MLYYSYDFWSSFHFWWSYLGYWTLMVTEFWVLKYFLLDLTKLFWKHCKLFPFMTFKQKLLDVIKMIFFITTSRPMLSAGCWDMERQPKPPLNQHMEVWQVLIHMTMLSVWELRLHWNNVDIEIQLNIWAIIWQCNSP